MFCRRLLVQRRRRKGLMTMTNATCQTVLKALDGGTNKVLITCHISPDGDCIGAALAVKHYLDGIHQPYVLVNDDEIPTRYDFLPGIEQFVRTKDVTEEFSLIVAVDCADRRRMGTVPTLFTEDHVLINIDHHETNDHYGHVNLVEPEASATCLVLYRLFHAAGIPMGKPLAYCLYTGIVFDTGGFRYNNTTPEVHMVAADLLKRGIEPFLVADRVLESMTREQAELVRLGLATLTVDDSGLIAYVVVDHETLVRSGADEGDTEVLLPYTRSLSGVEVGVLFRENADGVIKVSLRSRERVDVSAIAVRFGGGGHIRAAGCSLHVSVADSVSQVLTAVREAVAKAFL